MQNTMVEGERGNGRWGKKIKHEDLGGRNEKGERKTDENDMKTGKKALKINSKTLKEKIYILEVEEG